MQAMETMTYVNAEILSGATMSSESCVALQKFHSVVRYIVLTNMCLDWMFIASSGSKSYLLKMYTDLSHLGVQCCYMHIQVAAG